MNIKKIIASTTAISVVATQAMTWMVAAATPVAVNATWESAVNFMKVEGLSSTANSVNEYDPMGLVRREAASKLFTNFAAKKFGTTADETKVCSFSDLYEAQSWATPYILKSCQMGIFKGSDGKFMPKATLTKLQFLTVLARIVKKDSTIEPAGAFNALKNDGITMEATLADTVKPVNRIELAMLFQRAVAKYASNSSSTSDNDSKDISDIIANILGDKDDNANTTTGSTTTGSTTTSSDVVGSKLVVSLNPNTPASQNIPRNSANVEYLKFDISAGDQDVTVKTLKFKRINLGSRNNFDKVWVTKNGVVVSNDKSISSEDTVELTLNRVIKAGTKETFTLNASMQASGTVVNQFKLIDVTSNSSNMSFDNVVSNAMTTVNYTVAALTFDKKGSNSTIDTSKEGETIGEFKLTESESNSKKDVILQSIRFRASGGVSITENLSNIALYVDNTKVSKTTEINGDYITFTFDSYVIADGKSKLFTVKADVLNGDDNDTLTLKVRDTFDIYATEQGTNAWARIELNDSGSLATYKLNAGRVSISRDTTNPSSDEYVKDTDDVLAMVAKVDTDQKIEIDSLKLFLDAGSEISGGNTEANLNKQIENVRLYVNDKQIDSVDKITVKTASNIADWQSYYYFKSSFEVNDDDKIKVYVKLQNGAEKGTRLRFKLDNSGSTVAGTSKSLDGVEYASDGQLVAKEKLTGTATSNYITVVDASAGVGIARNDGFGPSDIILAGQQSAQLMKFIVNAGNSSAMKIKKLQFNFAFNALDSSKVTNVRLVKADGSQIGSTESVNSEGKVVIDSIDLDIAKGGQEQFRLVADIDTSAPNGEIKSILKLQDSSSVIYDLNDNAITNLKDIEGVNLTVKTNAGLTVALDGDTPKSAIIIAGTKDVDVAKFKFTAKDGDVNIKKLYFAVQNNAKDSASNYKLVVDGKTVDSRAVVDNKLTFDLGSANQIVVPRNWSKVVTVKADLNNISSVEQTNKQLIVYLKDMEAVTAATSNDIQTVNGSGINVANHYVGSGNFATSNEFFIRKTQPTLTTVSVPTKKLTPWEQTLYKFTVTADSKEDVTVSSIKFNVVKSANVTLADYKLYVNGSKIDEVTFKTHADGGVRATFNTTITWNNDVVVAKGTSKTFELKASVWSTSTLNDGDYVTTNIKEESRSLLAGIRWAMLWNENLDFLNFVWSDNSDSAGAIDTKHYFNGYKVNGLSTTSVTLEK